MHAYDLATLQGPLVAARRAAPGEKLVTLDDVPRTLTDDMIVIADAGGAIGVAGVMGAAHVEVGETTTDLFLECAWFDPRRVRRARRRLGIYSEASFRFERGSGSVERAGGDAPLHRAHPGRRRAARWPARRSTCIPQADPPPRVFVRASRVSQVLGVRAAVERTGADAHRHRGHHSFQAGRRPHCGRRARLAAGPHARNRPDRGNRPDLRV